MEEGKANATVASDQQRQMKDEGVKGELQLWAEADKRVKKFKPWIFALGSSGTLFHLVFCAGHTVIGTRVDHGFRDDGTAIVVSGCLLALGIVLLHLILLLGTVKENEDNVRTYLKLAPWFMAGIVVFDVTLTIIFPRYLSKYQLNAAGRGLFFLLMGIYCAVLFICYVSTYAVVYLFQNSLIARRKTLSIKAKKQHIRVRLPGVSLEMKGANTTARAGGFYFLKRDP